MAANYWASTQRLYWQYSKDELADIRQKLEDEDRNLVQQYSTPDRRLLSIFFNSQLVKLSKSLSLRQQVLATAQVYIRRFYIKVDFRQTNPFLILATALYLACKMEESPQHIRAVVQEGRRMWSDLFPNDVSKLGESEFFLISELNSQLIVHHPYRTLTDLQPALKLSQDDLSLAWSIVNDSYLTDLPLLVPPHVVAITAIFLALTLKPNQQGGIQAAANTAAVLANSGIHKDGLAPPAAAVTASNTGTMAVAAPPASSTSTPQEKVEHFVSWLAEGEVDIQAVVEASQEIISLYDVWEQQYNEKSCKEQIVRFVKGRGLDKWESNSLK